jgi:basic amino acid/polyamine antiporter, APA family
MPQLSSLQKKIGFWSATSIITGSIIGSGVFMKPSSMAAVLGSPIWLTIVWVIAGLFSLFGALIYAELGAMMPQTGGIYVYFRKMFGEFVAFLYGWSAFSVINTAAVAAIAYVCAQYAEFFLILPRFDTITEQSIRLHIPFIGDLFPLENFGVKGLAIVLVLSLTYLNYRSVRAGNAFQVVSTFVKLAIICVLVLGIFFSGKGSVDNFFMASDPKSGIDLFHGIVIAMTGAFFAYDGWINITFVAGEIKDPQKNIPKSLFLGVFLCIAVYLLVNQAYLYVLPVEKVAASTLVASDAIAVAWGTNGAALIAGMIVICTIGAINGNAMASSRVTYAMGKDRVFLPWSGREHPKYNTPGNALWLHGIWTSMFILTGTFNMLADMFVFITWVAYLFGAIGIFLLRKRMPDAERPYRIWGYPWIPALFIIFSAFYLFTTVQSDIRNYVNGTQPVVNSLLGLAITLAGIPFYFYYKWKEKNRSTGVVNYES